MEQSAQTDLSLVKKTTGGDRQAFDELVRRHQSSVRRFFLHQTLGDAVLSDDLAQDTFLKAYLNVGAFRGQSSFLTWLMRIAYNVYYDHTRRAKPTVDVDQLGTALTARAADATPAASAADAPLTSSHTSLRLDLYTALALLRPAERTCITLQLADGYDVASIAHITQMKEGTVKSHLSRGKEKLANFLRKNGYDRR